MMKEFCRSPLPGSSPIPAAKRAARSTTTQQRTGRTGKDAKRDTRYFGSPKAGFRQPEVSGNTFNPS